MADEDEDPLYLCFHFGACGSEPPRQPRPSPLDLDPEAGVFGFAFGLDPPTPQATLPGATDARTSWQLGTAGCGLPFFFAPILEQRMPARLAHAGRRPTSEACHSNAGALRVVPLGAPRFTQGTWLC